MNATRLSRPSDFAGRATWKTGAQCLWHAAIRLLYKLRKIIAVCLRVFGLKLFKRMGPIKLLILCFLDEAEHQVARGSLMRGTTHTSLHKHSGPSPHKSNTLKRLPE